MHAEHSHGGPRHEQAGPSTAAGHETHHGLVRDPVCGMQVDPDHAAGMRTSMTRAFFFCSAACVEKFDRDPEGYARRSLEAASPESSAASGMHPHARH